MVISKACSYGILASLYLAQHGKPQNFTSIREISDDLDISFHFLTKILQTLTEKGIVISLRGPKGGVSLAKGPETTTLYDIIVSIDGPELFTECILGLPGCGQAKPCPMHDHWKDEREQLKENFKSKTLASVSNKIEEFKLRLSRREF